ncbi:MAG TPA: histidine kinase [Gaiellaceae bacterium]
MKPGRLWLAYWVAALVVGAIGMVLVLTSNHEDRTVPTLVLGLLLGWSFIASGLVARARSPENPTGRLMVAFGFVWFLGALIESNRSLVFTLGAALSSLFAAVFVHLLLAYPTGRLTSRVERRFVAFVYVLAALGPTAFLLVERNPQGCGKCPDNAFLAFPSHAAADVVGGVLTVLAATLLVTVIAVLVRRWRRATPAARRVLAPVYVSGLGASILLIASALSGIVFERLGSAIGWVALFGFVCIPVFFLLGLLRANLARASVARLLVDVPEERPLAETQDVLRRILRDPSLELAYWVPDRRRYVDAHWRPYELPEPTVTRTVTPIQIDGRPVAALVHDVALHNEQLLLTDTAAAVGLRLEQARRLHELHSSEERMRALLDAMPDNMYRVDRAGRYLDYSAKIPEDLVLPPDDLLRSSIPEAVQGHVAAILMDGIRRALASGDVVTVEYGIQRRRGLRDVESRIVRSGEDEVVIIVRDITERKQAEAELERLQGELRDRLVELQASRARIVEAGDAERRRLERNLHDGAQQRLVSLSLTLRLAKARIHENPDAAQELLNGAAEELAHALEELRELARGIHPAVLTERGLEPALEALVLRAPVPVAVDTALDGRLPPPVEAAAFYVVSEALANVAKYAEASSVEVRVGRADGYAVVEVADDGVGGADPTRGSGLRGLADRVESLQGRLEVDSRPGEGTRVRAEIPVA